MATIMIEPINAIEEWRRTSGMTYQDIADAMGEDVSLVWRHLQKEQISDAFLFRFLRTYGRATFNALFPELAIK